MENRGGKAGCAAPGIPQGNPSTQALHGRLWRFSPQPGHRLFCIDLYTGKESRYERMDVMGTMEPENLPGWARHGLTAIQQEQAQKKTNKERER